MAVRKTDTEFGGRGGLYPPAEFVVAADLSAHELAALERRTEGTGVPAGDVTVDTVRAELEKRARLNDRVGQ